MRRSCAVLRFGIVLLLAAAVWYGVVVAQTPSGGHEQHHPAAPPDAPLPASSAPPPVSASAGMGEMMRSMGAAPPKEIYPSLMDLPNLPPEKRADVQRAAHERMQSGTTLMIEGLEQLLRAATTDDNAAMQAAVTTLREGLTHFDSGLAAHRALADGRDVRQLALQWFKSQMRLPEPPVPAEQPGPWGLSWSHLLVMALLTVFAVIMITMYFFKMRRVAHLLQRLTSPPASVAPPVEASVPTAMSVPAPSAPADTPPTLPAAALARADPAPIVPVEVPRVVSRGPWSGSLRIARIFTETPTIKTFRLVNPAGGPIPGVPRDRIKTEAFGPVEKPSQRQATVQAAMAKAHLVTTPTVTFTLSGKAAPLPLETTVLEAAEHVGVPIDSSCRVGTCGTCKVPLLKGVVIMAVEDALTPQKKARGIILACQAMATDNIEVEA